MFFKKLCPRPPLPRPLSRLESLPNELLLQICGYLSQDRLRRVRLVCRSLNEPAAAHVRIWHGSMKMELFPSSLAAFTHFVKTRPREDVEFLTIWTLDSERFMRDVRRMVARREEAAKASSNKIQREIRKFAENPPQLDVDGTKLLNLDLEDTDLGDVTQREPGELYYDIASWAKPLREFLKVNLRKFDIHLSATESLSWSFSFLRKLFEELQFNTQLELTVCMRALSYKLNLGRGRESSQETARLRAIGGLFWADFQEELHAFCLLVQNHIFRGPIKRLHLEKGPLPLSGLQELFKIITPPTQLILEHEELDFEEYPDDGAVNEEAIKGLAAALPCLQHLTVKDCRHKPGTNIASWGCFFAALKGCRELESLHFRGNENLVFFGERSYNMLGSYTGSHYLIESKEAVQTTLDRIICDHEVQEILPDPVVVPD